MDCFKIEITSWTASFRYPNLISGFQPTLEVPPISTVLGIINAASGSYQAYNNPSLGYYFEYEAKSVDLETIYQMEGKGGTTSNNAKSNVIRREFLMNASLSLYIKDERVVKFFENPVYPLLLGRMNDLASIKSIKKIHLDETENAPKIKGQVVPFIPYYLAGQIQALPKYFTDTFPRNNIGTEPYSVISYQSADLRTNILAYRDEVYKGRFVDIFMHDLDFTN
jgi:CRISPR-associated protein Cas5t